MARDLALERAWRKRMGEYERSGLTIRDFCEQEGLVAHRFSWWRSELKRRAANPDSKGDERPSSKPSPKKTLKRAKVAANGFVPVQIGSASQTAIEIVLDQPPRIKVSSGFDAGLLREIVRVLESR